MAGLLTLDHTILWPHFSLFREILAPTLVNALGGGTMQTRRRYPRPTYQFRLHDSEQVQASAEALYGFAVFVQGDMPFWFDGGAYGTLSTPTLYALGDGVRTQFLLPNRHITGGTLQTYTNDVLDAVQPTCDLASGLVTHAAAPSGTLKAMYACTYKCVFVLQGDALLSAENFAHQLYKADGIILKEFIP